MKSIVRCNYAGVKPREIHLDVGNRQPVIGTASYEHFLLNDLAQKIYGGFAQHNAISGITRCMRQVDLLK